MHFPNAAAPEFSEILIDAMHHEASDELFSLESPSLLAIRLRERVRVNPAYVIGGSGKIVVTPPRRLADADGFDVSGGVFAGYEGAGRILVAADGKTIAIRRMRKDEHIGLSARCAIAVEDKSETTAFSVALPGPEGKVWRAAIISGPARIAYASHGPMRPMPVRPDSPAFVKPGFVVGWTIGLQVEAKGRSAEDSRLSFSGQGTVFIQSSPDTTDA